MPLEVLIVWPSATARKRLPAAAGAAIARTCRSATSRTSARPKRARGATVEEVCLYEWRLPEDVAPLERLVDEIVEGRIDALVITSQVQCRHLFEIAGRLGKRQALTDALNARVVVAAVGPVCASALRAVGVIPHVQPAHPKMGPMMIALADYYELTGR